MGNPKRMANRTITLFTMLAEFVLGIRVIFSLLDADTTNSFVRWVYSMSETLLAPFNGMFPAESFDHRYVLEFRVLFAMAAIGFVAYVAMGLLETVRKPKVDRFDWKRYLSQ